MLRILQRHFLEPISSLTHLGGALASLVALVILVALTGHEPKKMVSLAIYGLSMVVLFATSALFHGMILPDSKRMWLNRLDHAAIFLLIAGTYTPIVYNLYPEPWRWSTLIVIWTIAAAGIIFKLFSSSIHGFLNASVYPLLSWAGVIPVVLVYRLKPLAPIEGIGLLLLGGMIYMVGFVIYYRRRPDPWPPLFGHHEIWHILVLAGGLCHFLFMLFYVVP